ncbi:MAG: LysR substrate-binding domain-containing protein [Rhodocyclaceae bacterium]|nr:LysR substrate-binding domain-containing protein [Rhodocyclaceae bacterium]
MKLTLEALQLLDAIDLRGSFAAAADELHRVPSAVTHAVRRLEQDLGVALFARAGRRAVPTAAGRALLEEGRHLLRAAGELECRVRRVATGWESALTIAVDATIDTALLFPLLADFDRENGGTRLRLTCEVLGGGWDAIVTGRADLAVGAPGEPPPGGGWTLRPFGTLEFVFAVAPGHPLAAAAEPLALQRVAPHRVIVLADTSRQLLARTAGLASGADTLTVATAADKLAAIRAGLGVGHLPRALAEQHAASGGLVIKRLAERMPPVTRHLAWRTEHEGKALAWFVARLDTPSWRRRLLGPDKGRAPRPAAARHA